MHACARAVLASLLLAAPYTVRAQAPPRTLVVVLAHADDEAPVAPLLARYAREGARVHMLIASDGGQGVGAPGIVSRPDSGPRGEELVRARAEEGRCAARALGAQPPILLGFPDGKLGDYIGDRSLSYRLTARIAEELQRLRPDAVVTWGPDGGVGHPDHRLVSAIATQLVRADAPGAPERLFYMYLPEGAIRAMNPQRGVPPLLLPAARHFTVRVPFAPEDLQAAMRAMECHRSQITAEAMTRVAAAMPGVWNGVIALVPAFATAPATELFR